MRRAKWILAAVIGAELLVSVAAAAQSNDDDYTPLNSRIRRERQFPIDLHNPWGEQTNAVSRKRNREMLNQFTGCVFNRSHEASLDLLRKTDYGFVSFEQIGLEQDRALRVFGFRDCLSRVADSHGTGVQLRWSAPGLRQWLVQEAYFDLYENAPSWIRAGIVIGERAYPLSAQNPNVRGPMDLGDCVVVNDPYTADFLYRTVAGSEEERQALNAIAPALQPCLPRGVQVEFTAPMLRVWLGEALWHAANNSAPAPAEAPEGAG